MGRWQRWLLRRATPAVWAFVILWIVAIGGGLGGWWRPRGSLFAFLFASICAAVIVALWARWQRERAVREAALPQFLKRKLRETYPQMSGKDCDLVERGLRQFFLACLRSNRKFVAMPSRAVDTMWHEFILHTRGYRDWCDLTLGRFLHHTPAEALGPKASSNDGLRRAWYWACRDEAINPRRPSRLPLLFALDAKLGIANGFAYVPDCGTAARLGGVRRDDGGPVHCGSSFSDGDYGGDAASFGGSDGGSGGDGAGSSGDGGGSCGGDGGGGCGGGD